MVGLISVAQRNHRPGLHITRWKIWCELKSIYTMTKVTMMMVRRKGRGTMIKMMMPPDNDCVQCSANDG